MYNCSKSHLKYLKYCVIKFNASYTYLIGKNITQNKYTMNNKVSVLMQNLF